MFLPNPTQIIIITTLFLIPITTYLLLLRHRFPHGILAFNRSRSAPLPPPTPITALYIYPIKSCHGIPLPSARLLPTGLDLDRQWMWVTYPTRQFLTIRAHAKMTLIRPSYCGSSDTLTVTAPAPAPSSKNLSFTIPAHPTPAWLAQHTNPVEATVWSTTTPCHEYAAELTAPFNAFFGHEVRLVYKPAVSSSPRALVGNGKKELLGRAGSTCFADLMPVLVGSEKSVMELNGRLACQGERRIDVTRFRPNVLVAGTEAWAEDRWKTISIQTAPSPAPSPLQSLLAALRLSPTAPTLDVVARCARCHVPNVDPETAEEHKRQPWDTLMKYRRVDPGISFKPCFGMLCVPRGGGGRVDVGMEVRVMEVTDGHRYVTGM
ncbi:hypothetical protein K432DRAFT_387199 [Lepidopterella palustris CBS 459.81]|uniref:MOSC domain-containing protein n=1 Tax=Lepidopterella palustris CBS 459.81 TaxID=1314670 RepID=A0A8E2DYC6_9PEZI|nr:hypothetical protein K432DRAFT_387199 [Lepidopterella palustris CBS 459.81]